MTTTSPLPIYARAGDMMVREYHHPSRPGPQLKDLVDQEAASRGIGARDLLEIAAEGTIPDAENTSASFRLFVDDLRQW